MFNGKYYKYHFLNNKETCESKRITDNGYNFCLKNKGHKGKCIDFTIYKWEKCKHKKVKYNFPSIPDKCICVECAKYEIQMGNTVYINEKPVRNIKLLNKLWD